MMNILDENRSIIWEDITKYDSPVCRLRGVHLCRLPEFNPPGALFFIKAVYHLTIFILRVPKRPALQFYWSAWRSPIATSDFIDVPLLQIC